MAVNKGLGRGLSALFQSTEDDYSKNLGSLGVTEEELVSSDIIGITYGSLFDATQTMVAPMENGDTQVQVVSWYDNENSYTSQMVRTIKYFAELN